MINSVKRTANSFILLFFCVFSFSLVAQEGEQAILDLINIQLQNNDDEVYFYDGKVSLKDNTTIDGRISVNNKRYGEYFTIVRMKDSCMYIPNTKISFVVLNENQKGTIVETKFEGLNTGDRLYRQIFHNETKNITVYDTAKRPFRNVLLRAVFVKENDLITDTYNFWTSGPKKCLINYLNKRHKTKYKRRDFKSVQDLFEKI